MINQTKLLAIVKSYHSLETQDIEFGENPLIEDDDYKELVRLSKVKGKWSEVQEEAYLLFTELREKYRSYFHEGYFIEKPNEAYAEENTLGKNDFVGKIDKKIKDSDDMFYIYKKDEDHQYSLNHLIYKLYNTVIDALYNEAVRRSKKLNVLAHSHSNLGWIQYPFKLDKDFSIVVNTNFGYGNSSYFELLIVYKDIHLTRYSNIIYYPFAALESLIHSTRSYPVTYQSFEPCYKFVCDAYNEFYESKDSFIVKYIEDELIKLTKGLLSFIDATEVNYYDYHKSFLNVIGSSRQTKKFEGIEVNLFRTQKAIDVTSLIPSIKALGELINIDPYLTQINSYNESVLIQNNKIFETMVPQITQKWHEIEQILEAEMTQHIQSIFLSLSMIKKYDGLNTPSSQTTLTFSVKYDLVFRSLQFLQKYYLKYLSTLYQSISGLEDFSSNINLEIPMNEIIHSFPELSEYQKMVSILIDQYLNQLSPEKKVSNSYLVKELSECKIVLNNFKNESCLVVFKTLKLLNGLLKSQLKEFLSLTDLTIILKTDEILNQFNEYIGLIDYYALRTEAYKSVLKRCKNKECQPLLLLVLFSIHRLEQIFSIDSIKNELYRDIYYKLNQKNQKEFNLDYDVTYKDIYLPTKLKEDIKGFFNIIDKVSSLASLTSDLINY